MHIELHGTVLCTYQIVQWLRARQGNQGHQGDQADRGFQGNQSHQDQSWSPADLNK